MPMISLLHEQVERFFRAMGGGCTLSYYPYRTARVDNWIIKLPRNTALMRLLEHWFAWVVSTHKDDKCVYGVTFTGDNEIVYYPSMDTLPDYHKTLYFWFADTSVYVGFDLVRQSS